LVLAREGAEIRVSDPNEIARPGKRRREGKGGGAGDLSKDKLSLGGKKWAFQLDVGCRGKRGEGKTPKREPHDRGGKKKGPISLRCLYKSMWKPNPERNGIFVLFGKGKNLRCT